MKTLGISGWSGCGKTTLIVALILRLRAQGLTVSTLKQAHHDVDLDIPGKDTWRHREAGAQEVILVTGQRWALLHELRKAPEPSLTELLAYLQPVDLVLVEGWKNGEYPKVEIWRTMDGDRALLFPDDPTIIAVASDLPLDPACYGRPNLPTLPLNDVEAIACFVVNWLADSVEPTEST